MQKVKESIQTVDIKSIDNFLYIIKQRRNIATDEKKIR